MWVYVTARQPREIIHYSDPSAVCSSYHFAHSISQPVEQRPCLSCTSTVTPLHHHIYNPLMKAASVALPFQREKKNSCYSLPHIYILIRTHTVQSHLLTCLFFVPGLNSFFVFLRVCVHGEKRSKEQQKNM